MKHSGSRRGESATIKKKDIRQNEETGRWFIFIEKGKTDRAQRQIPFHNAVESSLLNLIKKRKPGDLVFSTLPNYTVACSPLYQGSLPQPPSLPIHLP